MAITLIKHSGMYVGRTDDYYCDDDESVFTPEYWTYSDNRDSDEFAAEGPVRELNADGMELLADLRKAHGFNQYQADRSWSRVRDLYHRSWNSMWEDLTDLSMIVPEVAPADAIHVDVKWADTDWGESKDDVQHFTFRDTALEAIYEHACDCLYYGEGRPDWLDINADLDPELRDAIWQMATAALEDDYRY